MVCMGESKYRAQPSSPAGGGMYAERERSNEVRPPPGRCSGEIGDDGGGWLLISTSTDDGNDGRMDGCDVGE